MFENQTLTMFYIVVDQWNITFIKHLHYEGKKPLPPNLTL